MSFSVSLHDDLKVILKKIIKKDRSRYEIVMKKIEQIASGDDVSVDRFKNLRHDLSDRKRVHIDRNFVLTFKVDKNNHEILFLDLEHHDNAY